MQIYGHSHVKEKKSQAVPSELLSKEFLSQFKTEEDVSQSLKDLHAQVLEQMLQGELDAHLGYENIPQKVTIRVTPAMEAFRRKSELNMVKRPSKFSVIVTVILLRWSFPSTRVVVFPLSGSSSLFMPKVRVYRT